MQAGRHIWLIGAGSGIGRALAVALARDGAILTLSGRNADALESLRAELGGAHGIQPLDVTDDAAVETAAQHQKRIDSVILLAGAYEPLAMAAITAATARTIIDTNLTGAFNVIRATLPRLRAQGAGQIVLCGSVAGYCGLPNGQPYSATKAALINLAQSLRAEERKNNIDVRIINPGFVDTPMTRKNPFPMPAMIDTGKAAAAILKGLAGDSFEIHFPRRLTWGMKLLRLLPYPLYFRLVERL